jgi:nucleoside-diphosphate-sugar epimerase
MAAFGIHSERINEQTESNAKETGINYFRTKAMAEDEVMAGVEKGLDAVIVNPANILGPYDLANWAQAILMIKAGKFPGVGSGGGSFCHASEVVKAMIAAAEIGRKGSRYLLGGADASYQEVITAIQKEVGGKVPKKPLPTVLLKAVSRIVTFFARLSGKDPVITPEIVTISTSWIRVDSSKAENELGYKPVGIEEIVKDTCEWFTKEYRSC